MIQKGTMMLGNLQDVTHGSCPAGSEQSSSVQKNLHCHAGVTLQGMIGNFLKYS